MKKINITDALLSSSGRENSKNLVFIDVDIKGPGLPVKIKILNEGKSLVEKGSGDFFFKELSFKEEKPILLLNKKSGALKELALPIKHPKKTWRNKDLSFTYNRKIFKVGDIITLKEGLYLAPSDCPRLNSLYRNEEVKTSREVLSSCEGTTADFFSEGSDGKDLNWYKYHSVPLPILSKGFISDIVPDRLNPVFVIRTYCAPYTPNYTYSSQLYINSFIPLTKDKDGSLYLNY